MHITAADVTIAVVVFILTAATFFAVLWRQQDPL